jgi:methyltransferase
MVTSAALYLGGLSLLALERVYELVLARRNARIVLARGGIEVGRAHFRVMAIVHTLFLVSCAAEVVLGGRKFPGALGVVALVAALSAQGLRHWAVHTLGERWNVRIIVEPNAAPVTGGPYRFLRHPNYLAVIVELAAVPLVHGAWITAVVFSLANALILAVRIRAEERALGSSWAEAFERHPRLYPRIRPEVPS